MTSLPVLATEGVPFAACFELSTTPVGSDFVVTVMGNPAANSKALSNVCTGISMCESSAPKCGGHAPSPSPHHAR